MTKNKRAHIKNPAWERGLKKMRCDSNWNGLTYEQCETVEQWLFEDNLGYQEIVARARQEFGLETSRWSVGRFFRQRARARQSLELWEAQVTADELRGTPAKTSDLRETTMKLLAKSAMRLAVEKPGEVEQLLPLARLLVESEANEIRLRRVKLEERYFDFEANTGCAKELEKVRAYVRVVGDNDYLSAAEKQERVIGLLFGKDEVDVAEAEEMGPEEESEDEGEDEEDTSTGEAADAKEDESSGPKVENPDGEGAGKGAGKAHENDNPEPVSAGESAYVRISAGSGESAPEPHGSETAGKKEGPSGETRDEGDAPIRTDEDKNSV